MPSSSVLDAFDQWVLLRVAGAAALSGDVATQLQTGITNNQKLAWEASRIEYSMPYEWLSNTVLNTAPRAVVLGLTQSSASAQNPSPDNAAMVDWMSVGGNVEVSAVGELGRLAFPIVHDFRDHPILVLPQTLYAFLHWSTGANLTTGSAFIKVWYKEHELTSADWYDLLQLRLPLGVS